MVTRRKNRFWSDDEKRSICLQTQTPGVSVAQVARRYALNDNLIFKWLKDSRFAPEPEADAPEPEKTTFLPVEIEGTASSPASPHLTVSPPSLDTAVSATRVDITLSDGRRILVEGATELSMVLALVEGLRP